MKNKSLLGGLLALIAVIFSACDDDLNTVGSSIQPGGDGIYVKVDTAYIEAGTILMDSMYARSSSGLLGKYEDDSFGTIKSDFLTEFYCAENGMVFKDDFIEIDSVQVDFEFVSFDGDTLAPMGVSIFKVTSPLKRNFYSNIDPSEFCDMKEMLGQQAYTIAGVNKLLYSSVWYRTLTVDLDKQLGYEFYNEYLRDKTTFESSANLKKYFPGIYVTTTFGSGSLIDVGYTYFKIHYKYNDVLGNYDGTQDTIRTSIFELTSTSDVIQMNHVISKGLDQYIGSGTNTPETPFAYIKSPAGLCTELTLPINYIKEQMAEIAGEKEGSVSINTAFFSIKGNTEKETGISFGRPKYLLLIDKDSIDNFFLNKKTPDYKTCTYAQWSSTTNSYSFSNIADIVDEYRKRADLTEDPKFVLLPITIDLIDTGTGSSAIQTFYRNYLKPAISILRSSEKDMRLELTYSRIE